MNINLIISEVKQMRKLQKEYFSLRKKGEFTLANNVLTDSKKAERNVDKMVLEYESKQLNLFNNADKCLCSKFKIVGNLLVCKDCGITRERFSIDTSR